MEIIRTEEGGILTLALSGRLDTNTAPLLEAELKDSLENAAELVLDFAQLEYVSSAGLKVLLVTMNYMAERDRRMVVRNVGPVVMGVFEITGFNEKLAIE